MPDSPAQNGTLGDALIPVINRLQDLFSQVTLDFKVALPQVAVVGSQSSGKSSVLEALVGRDFLPRGPEICTRRPLVLQLVKTPATSGQQEWGEFLHAPGKVFHDFDRIRQEIQSETDRVSGTHKNISEKPIRLKICSPHVLTMTLIDLPGITKVPVGDQPLNIEHKIREMIYSYIREPSCIILAVSAANTDLANSDALQMAQMVDAEGTRTIGVVTKLDIMDRGTNAVPLLKNQVVPLRLGYVGVILRSQADINVRKSMADARRAEEAFFMHHPEYREVSAQCGVSMLARRLNVILVQHIRSLLPGLRRQIAEALEARQQELRTYGTALELDGDAARGAVLLQLLCQYAERFSAMLDGRCEDMPLSELTGGARIRHIFLEIFNKQLRQLDPMRELTDDDVRTAIKNSSGVSGTLLIPQEPFEVLVRRSITKVLPPSLLCKDLVYDELIRIAEAACPRDVGRFPVLQRRLATAVLDFIQAGAGPAERMITELVECEHNYINTDHPEFIGGTRAVKVVMEEREFRRASGAGASNSGTSSDTAHHHSRAGAAEHQLAKTKSSGALLANGDGRGSSSTAGGGGLSGLAANGPMMGLKGLHESTSTFAASDGAVISARGLRTFSRETSDAGHSGAANSGDGMASSSGAGGSSWFGWLTKGDASSGKREVLAEAFADASIKGTGKPRSEHEEVQLEVIRLLVSSYFDIVRNNMADLVPKTLMRFLVHHSQKGMQQHLIATLYRDHLVAELIQEREEVAKARAKCTAAVAALQAASEALEDVPAELSNTLANAEAAASRQQPAASVSGFSLPERRVPLGPADRHPSMHMAAQITAATTLTMPSAPAAAAGALDLQGGAAGGRATAPMPVVVEDN